MDLLYTTPLVMLLLTLRRFLPENFFIMSLQSYAVNIQEIEQQVSDNQVTSEEGIEELRSMAEALIERHKL